MVQREGLEEVRSTEQHSYRWKSVDEEVGVEGKWGTEYGVRKTSTVRPTFLRRSRR